MALEPGTQAYNNALDAHITGNYGADHEGFENMDDEFYDLAEKTLAKNLQKNLMDVLRNKCDWDIMLEESSFDQARLQRYFDAVWAPGDEWESELFIKFYEAVRPLAKLMAEIGFDEHKVTELARELEDGYWDRKDRGRP